MLEMNWTTRQGTQQQRPVILDTVSSPSTVYLRKNITQATVKETDGSKHKVWSYDEIEIARADYEREPAAINEMAQLIEQQAATEAANAEILLAQTDTQIQLDAQDEALAEILLNII